MNESSIQYRRVARAVDHIQRNFAARPGPPEPVALPAPVSPRGGLNPKRLPLHVQGSNLQVQAWRALLRIPPGARVAYGETARGLARKQVPSAVETEAPAGPAGRR